MFARYTEGARQVIVLGQDEARSMRHNYIGTEHILLGLLRVEEGIAAHVLELLDVTIDKARAEVVRLVGEGDELATGQIPFTPRAKKVLELGLREAPSLGDNHVGTEHLLLGLVREREGAAVRVLLALGVSPETVRDETIEKQNEPERGIEDERSREKRGRHALEAAMSFVTAARELAVANGELHRASEIEEVEQRLKALLMPPG